MLRSPSLTSAPPPGGAGPRLSLFCRSRVHATERRQQEEGGEGKRQIKREVAEHKDAAHTSSHRKTKGEEGEKGKGERGKEEKCGWAATSAYATPLICFARARMRGRQTALGPFTKMSIFAVCPLSSAFNSTFTTPRRQ